MSTTDLVTAPLRTSSRACLTGLIELACLALHLVPRTALGGAIATHVRLENPLFSHVLFPT